MPYKDPEARKRYVRNWYLKNRPRLLAYAERYRAENSESVSEIKKRIYHERYKNDPDYKGRARIYGQRRRKINRQHVRDIERASYEKHLDARRAYQKEYSQRPERRAHEAVNGAVRRGIMVRAQTHPCAQCGAQHADVYHHHLGYEPAHFFDVTPLCHQCHVALHFAARKTAPAS